MSQTIEIEFKNLLNMEEFNRMVSSFQLRNDQFIEQINHYFDSNSFALKNKGCALRIREKKSQYELTLKQPHPDGLLETNQNLTDQEAEAFINGGQLKEGAVKSQITALGIDSAQLVYFGTLTTERAELTYHNGLLVLDKSSYLNTIDYEVEYEVINREQGLPIFLALLSQLNIPVRQTKNKVQRFYERKIND
jgi:uncharacterized protein YjbK